MNSATVTKEKGFAMTTQFGARRTEDTIETRLWLEEHDWLYALLKSEQNISPTFRFPDLISACVSLVFAHDDASERIFDFLGTRLVLRPPLSQRRRESMWMPQYELLLAVQRSPANRHPNPKFQLYTPTVMRHDVRTDCKGYPAINFGDSKGKTFDRVLIFPNGPIKSFLSSGNIDKITAAPKYYVAFTRARFSVAFAYDGACKAPNVSLCLATG